MLWLFRTRVPPLHGEKSPEEAALLRSDDFNPLQCFRLNLWENPGDKASENTVSVTFLHIKESLRKIY